MKNQTQAGTLTQDVLSSGNDLVADDGSVGGKPKPLTWNTESSYQPTGQKIPDFLKNTGFCADKCVRI